MIIWRGNSEKCEADYEGFKLTVIKTEKAYLCRIVSLSYKRRTTAVSLEVGRKWCEDLVKQRVAIDSIDDEIPF